MIYQHPLAYLLGIEGIALLRAFAGDHSEAFTLARLDEIRRLLDDGDALGPGIHAVPIDTRDGYRDWAWRYDDQENQLIELEQPVVRRILDGLPVGVAVDVACGTGRHAQYLAGLRHTVTGVDSSADMLAVARVKLPDVSFLEGDLHALPVADGSVDVLVCALALTHVPDLAPAFAEFVRVLRPGGHLVTSDSRGLIADIGLPIVGARTSTGDWGYMPAWTRLASDYLSVALPLGLQVRECVEPRRPAPLIDDEESDMITGGPPPPVELTEPWSVWALHDFAVEATNAAWAGNPAALIWHFQKDV
ncbi:MAG: class I SAM-dependent methyltransferase [Chloroflexota bacterium]|nr:class I SAM-dependent methyltransferase [Chloroflexota bacterium]